MKYLTTILLSLFTSCLFAQNPTYEQTVEFIKTNVVGRMLYEGALDNYKRATGHKLTKIEIQKNGRIKLVANQQYGKHDFDIVFNIFDLKSSIDYPDGIRAYKFLVHFQGLNVSKGYGITFATDADAKRVARAFRHLKTMCSKGGGLFDKPTQVKEKPTLSKSETLQYIENLIDNQPSFSYNELLYKNYSYTYKLNQSFSNGYLQKVIGTTNSEFRKRRRYMYSEEQKECNLVSTPIKKISLSAPGTVQKTSFTSTIDEYAKKYFSLHIYYDSDIKCDIKSRKSEYDNGNRWYSISDAKNSSKSESWLKSGVITKDVKIYIHNEVDANKLKKAFEHLLALMNEDKKRKKDNDPFGN